ncbi:MAG: hypothetical protein KF770_14420 [Anaerolineae bacterium]|nr:hypothetical protein [Anaerolineae bacterium]
MDPEPTPTTYRPLCAHAYWHLAEMMHPYRHYENAGVYDPRQVAVISNDQELLYMMACHHYVEGWPEEDLLLDVLANRLERWRASDYGLGQVVQFGLDALWFGNPVN